MPRRNKIVYWAELLPGNRGQLMCDVVIEDRIEMTYPIGSPAPLAVVQEHEYTVDLNRKAA